MIFCNNDVSVLHRFRHIISSLALVTATDLEKSFNTVTIVKQEAQLSQRDGATLRVIEYFAKSPKVIQGHSK